MFVCRQLDQEKKMNLHIFFLEKQRMASSLNFLFFKRLFEFTDLMLSVLSNLSSQDLFQTCILINRGIQNMIVKKYDWLFKSTITNEQLKKYWTISDTSKYASHLIHCAESSSLSWMKEYFQDLCTFRSRYIHLKEARYATLSSQFIVSLPIGFATFEFFISFLAISEENVATREGEAFLQDCNEWILYRGTSRIIVNIDTLIISIKEYIQESKDHLILVRFFPGSSAIREELLETAVDQERRELSYVVYNYNTNELVTPFPIPAFWYCPTNISTMVSVVFPRSKKKVFLDWMSQNLSSLPTN